MCGIIGIVGKSDVIPRLLSGLRSLEYRGYDSAGVAVFQEDKLHVRRSAGKIKNLEELLKKDPMHGMTGIGHTRWATHGEPSERNAHPHATDDVAVVHNGIIENHEELRQSLMGKGFTFHSDTDSEVITNLVTSFLKVGHSPEKAVSLSLEQLRGAFAIAMIFSHHDDLMICGRKGSPLVIGIGDNEMYLGSDAIALSPLTRKLVYLEEGDWAVLHRESYIVYNHLDQKVERPIIISSLQHDVSQKGDYPHYMLKEIYEQPGVVKNILESYVDFNRKEIRFPFDLQWESIPALTIVACGTSYYAGLVAQNWIERHASMPVRVEIASEFRYRQPPLPTDGITIAISQSGETADTLAALRYAKSKGQKIIGLVNVLESSIARESDYVLNLMAGVEIGVASTKAFIAQLTILSCLALLVGSKKHQIESNHYQSLLRALEELPDCLETLLKRTSELDGAARFIQGKKSVLYLGRGAHYPIAMEGALKLKELSYLHAEGAPSGELKHGSIALIDENTPIIFLLPPDELQEKNQSNLEEVVARKGKVWLFSDSLCVKAFEKKVYDGFEMPEMAPFFLPIVYTIPIQLLAYKTAVLAGNDVDQPRNLAKSVTVE